MRKLIVCFCLLCMTVAAKAQFEQGKWVINPSFTGLNFSRSEVKGKDLGVAGQIGAFLANNTALIVGLGAEWTDNADLYHASVGGRYYFDAFGVYVGAGLKMNHWKYHSSTTNIAGYGEVGYAFFITKTITIEPAVYYDLSFKDKDYSELGFKIGFGIYF